MAEGHSHLGKRNAILSALPEVERNIVLGACERVPLALREMLQEADQPLSHLWFPQSGVCSMITEMSDGGSVEVASIGREGFVGLTAVLDARRTAQRTFVQIPGEAHRLPVAAFFELRDSLPALRTLQLRYTLSLITQIAQSSACNRLHPVEQRCARWLLMTHDRVDGDVFKLTQEFLALMLGVTRPSVSIAASILQKAGLITYARGVIAIVDRAGLERACCECYGIIRREFERLVR